MNTYRELIDYLQAQLFMRNYSLVLNRAIERIMGTCVRVVIPIVVLKKIKILWWFSITRVKDVGLIYLAPNVFVPWPGESWESAYIGDEEILLEAWDPKDKDFIKDVMRDIRQWNERINVTMLEL